MTGEHLRKHDHFGGCTVGNVYQQDLLASMCDEADSLFHNEPPGKRTRGKGTCPAGPGCAGFYIFMSFMSFISFFIGILALALLFRASSGEISFPAASSSWMSKTPSLVSK